MTEYIWVRHPDTEAVTQIPKEALPMLRQSGWDTLPEGDIAERERAAVEEVAAAERSMQDEAARALAMSEPPTAVEVEPVSHQEPLTAIEIERGNTPPPALVEDSDAVKENE